ncbi:UNVERIFIED_CONTAM: hypothetical protein PYX00_006927 [Menopon gallinae]|uniref:PA domain-containing protein n=1 Tax=Menopon gallinae TaxID=328185 RepID=A0AAW2HGZ7_9NEOP
MCNHISVVRGVGFLSINPKVSRIVLFLLFFQILYSIAHHFNNLEVLSTHEIIGSDVFFEIIEPKELAYTYKIRPAQDFGTTFNATFSARNVPLVPAEPFYACDQLDNSDELYGNIALVERGECSFLTKSLNVEKAGALAIIVSDYDKDNDDLYIEMIDDNTFRQVNIPAGFLLGKNGYIIKTTLERLKRRYALINLPVNMTYVPLNKFNQPPWLGW